MSNLGIINLETGELVKKVDQTREKISVRSHKQNESYRKLKQEGKSRSFVFSEMKSMEEVASMLTTNQLGYLLVLITYIDYEGKIVKANREPMHSTEIQKTLKLEKKESTFYDFLNSCLQSGVISEETGAYFVNDQFHFKGKSGETPLVKVYSTTIRQLFAKNKISDLGNIYLLQSRVHKTKNVLVHNPNEQDESKIEFMTRGDIAELLGISEKQVGVIIRRLTIDDMKVVASMKVGSTTRYVVTPEIFARNVNTKDETLRFIFKTTK